MAFAPGARIGVYEIAALLGSGGMGEVYRATDTRLKRDVALKVLAEGFAQDADRLARLQREAELLATLNHPNIAAIYGIEEGPASASGPAEAGHYMRALVLELVDGPTLADRIAAGPLPVDEAIGIARQIADALEAAHGKGVMHRDLKPANIKLALDGTVKILDFGLAKMLDSPGPASSLTMSPTLSVHATAAGVILGTAAYMSPEQARGRPVDKRTDVWAFGCVLFEMLAGARAFDGEDVTEAIAAVVKSEPAWPRLPADVPDQIRLLLQRCLEKDPRARIGDISTCRFLMTETMAPSPVAAPVRSGALRRSIALAGGGLLAGAAVTVALMWLLRGEQLRPSVRFAIAAPATQPFLFSAFTRDIAVSRDGTHIVYVAGTASGRQLMVRSIDDLDPVALGPVDRGFNAVAPFVSPDGRWVGFFESGEIKKVSVTGGPVLPVCRIQGNPRGASWGPDGTIVFADDRDNGLFSVPEGGGEPRVLTRPDRKRGEGDHYFPSVLPGGTVLFTIRPLENRDEQIALLDLKTGAWRTILTGSQAEYLSSGHIVYAAAGTLRAVRFDPVRLEVLSDPIPVVDRVISVPTGAANFAVSSTGTLVYAPGGPDGDSEPLKSLVWVDRQGREDAINAPPRNYVYPRLSPDGTRVALDVRDQENDIWVWDLKRGTLNRLTFDPGSDRGPVWTPDSRRVLFSSQEGRAQSNLFWQLADGTGTVERLTTSDNVQTATSLTPDGTRLVFEEERPKAGRDLGVLVLDKTPRAEALIETAFDTRNAELSPDGRFIAYQSDESGQVQIYVRPFPKVNDGRWQVSTAGGTRPLWSRNGRELFYLDGARTLMAVAVTTTPGFSVGAPIKVFDAARYPTVTPQALRNYDVSPDGQRFLMIKDYATDADSKGTPAGLVVATNWFDELKRLLPEK